MPAEPADLGVPPDLGEGIVEDATRSFRDYFYVLTVASLPVAAMVWLAAILLSVPLGFTIALVTFVTSYVPYIGALISSVFALLIAFGAVLILAGLLGLTGTRLEVHRLRTQALPGPGDERGGRDGRGPHHHLQRRLRTACAGSGQPA